MAELPTSVTFTMPSWLDEAAAALPAAVPALPDRAAVVVELSRRNVEEASGGPFAAGVFERDSGRIVSLGVNRVVPTGKSCAHAEFMAISLAQEALGTWDLGAAGLPAHQLVVNWAPCAMCFGSVLWSGAVELVLAGIGPEMEALTGFDEGPLPDRWQDELAARGIAVHVDVARDDAIEVFRAYASSGAPVYNGRRGRS